MLENKKIGFIGGGQMCEAIFSGIVASKIVPPQSICITDVNADRLSCLAEKYGVNTIVNTPDAAGAKQVIAQSDIVVFSVKPQYARSILQVVSSSFQPNQLIISIMGGITLEYLEEFFPANPVLRVMPNTPMLVQKGIAGISAGSKALKEHCDLGIELFNLVGISYLLPENLIDPLTSVSGCSPAFAYMFIEALADGGVEKGLPREMAIKLAAQALAGSAEMVLQTGTHPAILKDNVCSPGGGTIAGVRALEKGAFRATVMDAVDASCARMIEVGKKA
ncbi:pyrroline-5-carboxylate reductase [Hydrogenoanaerobacterium saccharovorans]|uniref:Pyrroline-5-carboxylate reductase n=1 Tax=Hydrogenoanaerobacterium saccharovorans TaxID=474960 RepID=A0A1H7YVV4_9FIRM|nr:pyrroline-5-carboxylate reductase [Hydrogenoanaerobacterium saccharovorans]RPF48969.1 pyrroline-5-carboxylate reductase [Hydrogenoanaerobacterium saccharovorans]SEM50372.1 pyrroline-5-carboxylate reductase [Hydrogenoanaerobacterium saccharovorans]